jgi:hypothetical protein
MTIKEILTGVCHVDMTCGAYHNQDQQMRAAVDAASHQNAMAQAAYARASNQQKVVRAEVIPTPVAPMKQLEGCVISTRLLINGERDE